MAADSPLFQAVVFDFDGTLSDTPLDFSVMRANAWAAVTDVLADLDLTPPSLPEKELPLMEELDKLCAQLAPDAAASIREAAYASIVRTEVAAGEKATVFPGVRESLAAGIGKGVRFSIVTRNCKEAVLAAFPDVERYIPCILTRDDVPNPKPHPDHLLRALALLGFPPSKALMVGDHLMDIEVGKLAGTATAGVATGQTPHDRLADMRPDFLESTFSDLMRRIGIC